MASQDQLLAVQQDIEGVLGEVSEVKTSLAAAKQAGAQAEVAFLRESLLELRKKENSLHEEKNILMRAQPGG